MRRARTFNQSIINDVENKFAIYVLHKNFTTVDLAVPQYKIATTLQAHLDKKPKRIDLYWSSAPVYNVIIDDLNSQDVTDFERLELLIRRCPYLYVYSFYPRKTNHEKQL